MELDIQKLKTLINARQGKIEVFGDIKPGDILVAYLPSNTRQREIKAFTEQLKAILPSDVPVIIASHDVRFEKITVQ